MQWYEIMFRRNTGLCKTMLKIDEMSTLIYEYTYFENI